MKTNFFLIPLLVLTLNVFSQITVYDVDLISAGSVIYEGVDENPNNITIGNAGANQTWDFTTLQEDETDTTEVVSPVGTPYVSLYPDADMCIQLEDDLMYLSKNVSGIHTLGWGGAPLSNPITVVPLPLTYGLNFTEGPNTVLDSVFPNIFFPDSIAPYISFNPLHDQIDSINFNVVNTSEFIVDAWGDISIPMGTYPSLRVKVNETRVSDFYAYCSNSAGLGGGWYTLPPQLIPSEVETASRYEWWSNDPSTKFKLLTLELDSVNNIEDAVFLMQDPQSTFCNNSLNTNIFVFPNPTREQLIIETHLDNSSYSLIDISGKEIIDGIFNDFIVVDLINTPSGTYFLRIFCDDKYSIKKIIVQ